MSKITEYGDDSIITLQDRLIGSDYDSEGQTKNYSFEDIVSFLNENLHITGSSAPIHCTKIELDSLIANNLLIPGILYIISGVDPYLYNDGTNQGTKIYLNALTTNTLSSCGYGEFYNPKYDKTINGYGIWSDRSSWSATPTSEDVIMNGDIIANNGAIGRLFGSLETNFFVAISGDWSSATSITGGASANISNVILKTYAIGDKVIWGGYSWTNLTGNVGVVEPASYSALYLNSDWSKDVYDLNNYNKVIDYIEYDYLNDLIICRKDFSGNVVRTTKQNNVFFANEFLLEGNPINVFQWGNDYNESLELGIKENEVVNSYCENINFSGAYFRLNKLMVNSIVKRNIFINNSYMSRNILFKKGYLMGNIFINDAGVWGNEINYNSNISNNVVFNSASIYLNFLKQYSYINENKIIDSLIDQNVLSTSELSNNKLLSSFISKNEVNYGWLNNNTFKLGSNILSNIIQESDVSINSADNLFLHGNSFISGGLTQNLFGFNFNFEFNKMFRSLLSNQNFTASTGRIINQLSIENSSLSLDDYSLSSLMFDNTLNKVIYTRPDGQIRIRYYDNSDSLIISNL